MKQLTTYTIIRDGEMSKANSLEDAEELVMEQMLELLSFNEMGRLVRPDEPTCKDVRHKLVHHEGVPMLILTQYHRRTASVKVSATVQEVWR